LVALTAVYAALFFGSRWLFPRKNGMALSTAARPAAGCLLNSEQPAGESGCRPIDAIVRQARLIVRQSPSIMVVSSPQQIKGVICCEKAYSRRRAATRGPRRTGSRHGPEPEQPSSAGLFDHRRNERPAPAIQSDQHPGDSTSATTGNTGRRRHAKSAELSSKGADLSRRPSSVYRLSLLACPAIRCRLRFLNISSAPSRAPLCACTATPQAVAASFRARSAESWGMPRDPYVREKFTRDLSFARHLAREYFQRFPKDRYATEVESWRQIQSQNIEFTMKRLREPVGLS